MHLTSYAFAQVHEVRGCFHIQRRKSNIFERAYGSGPKYAYFTRHCCLLYRCGVCCHPTRTILRLPPVPVPIMAADPRVSSTCTLTGWTVSLVCPECIETPHHIIFGVLTNEYERPSMLLPRGKNSEFQTLRMLYTQHTCCLYTRIIICEEEYIERDTHVYYLWCNFSPS